MNWYEKLNKSPLTPPPYVFSIVWPILYLFMGIASIRIFRNKKCVGFCFPLILFFIQLFFNLIWTELFFKRRLIILAFIDLMLILVFLLFTLYYFYNIDKISALILLPYFLWCCFAAYLNYYIISNN